MPLMQEGNGVDSVGIIERARPLDRLCHLATADSLGHSLPESLCSGCGGAGRQPTLDDVLTTTGATPFRSSAA